MLENGERSLKPFLALWLVQSVSLLATHAVQFALVWWLTIETGSATIILFATVLAVAPVIVLMPFAGALVDRWNRKVVMLIADAAAAVAALALGILFLTGSASVAACIAAIAVRGVCAVFHQPAMFATTALLVPARHLTRMQGLNQMLHGVTMIVGAPLGGLLLALLPMHGIMLADVATALLAIAVLGSMRIPQPARPAEASPVKSIRDVWDDVMRGFDHLRQRPGCLGLAGLSGAGQLFMVWSLALLPLLVTETLGGNATQLAWINSAFGMGTIVGGVTLAAWGGFGNRSLTAIAGLFGMALATLAVGISQGALACGIAVLSVGALMPLVNGPIGAVLQTNIAPDYQGRVFSLMGFMAGVAILAGLLLAAPLASWLGVRTWYFIGAGACAFTALAALRSKTLIAIGHPAPVPQGHAEAG